MNKIKKAVWCVMLFLPLICLSADFKENPTNPSQKTSQKAKERLGEQWIDGKKYIDGRIENPFETDDPAEAMKSIYYFNNKENAKTVVKAWIGIQELKIAQKNLEINERRVKVKERKEIRKQKN